MNCNHLTITDLSPTYIANQIIGTSSGLIPSPFRGPTSVSCTAVRSGVWYSTAWAPLPKSTTNTGAQIALCSKLELRATPPPTACSQHDQIWAYSTVKPYRDSSYNKHSSQTDSRLYINWAGHEGAIHRHIHINTFLLKHSDSL